MLASRDLLRLSQTPTGLLALGNTHNARAGRVRSVDSIFALAAVSSDSMTNLLPDDEMSIRWCEVEVHLTTHDAGGVTGTDMDLAERFNAVYE